MQPSTKPRTLPGKLQSELYLQLLALSSRYLSNQPPGSFIEPADLAAHLWLKIRSNIVIRVLSRKPPIDTSIAGISKAVASALSEPSQAAVIRRACTDFRIKSNRSRSSNLEGRAWEALTEEVVSPELSEHSEAQEIWSHFVDLMD